MEKRDVVVYSEDYKKLVDATAKELSEMNL